MFDAVECREHARRYAMMAAKTNDPHLKQRFEETAPGWLRLAADMADIDDQAAKLWNEEKKDVA